jgi:hypothetical protein
MLEMSLTWLPHDFAAALLGAAVLIVAIGIDGFTAKALADAFANSPASEKASARIAGHAVELMHTGLFSSGCRCSLGCRLYCLVSRWQNTQIIPRGLAGSASPAAPRPH